MAVFPLGSVVLPGIGIPLHVFEERYRALVRDCLAADRRFATVLIERGSEVGGGDVRTDVGTVLAIRDAVELPDGRWGLGCEGVGRVRIVRWLADDPYPRAEVTDAHEVPLRDAAAVLDLVGRLRRVLALRAELGDPAAPATVELDDDPQVALWQIAALSTAGPMDLHAVLDEDVADRRAELVGALLDDQRELLEARLV